MTINSKKALHFASVFFVYSICVCVLVAPLFVISKNNSEKKRSDLMQQQEIVEKQKENIDISKTPVTQKETLKKLLSLLQKDDYTSIFVVVDTIHSDTTLSKNCHDLAHDIGHEAFELYGFTNAMNFTDPSRVGKTTPQEICAGGYVHGVIEKAALNDEEFSNNPGKVCEQTNVATQATCYHGVGHGLMCDTKRDTNLSLEGCRKLTTQKNKEATTRCFEGVWMEFFWTVPLDTQYAFDINNPLLTCSALLEDAKPACYLYSIFGYLKHHPKEYKNAIQLCIKNGENKSNISFCLKGIGIGLVGHFGLGNLGGVESMLSNLDIGNRRSLLQGILRYSLFSGMSKESLSSQCDSLVRDREFCLSVIQEYTP